MHIYLKCQTFAAKQSLVFPSGNVKSSFQIICIIMKLQLIHSEWGSASPSITVTSAHVQAQKQSAWPRGETREQSSAQDEVNLRFITTATNPSAYVSQTELLTRSRTLLHCLHISVCKLWTFETHKIHCKVIPFLVELIYINSLVIL